jgi:hypothetical protein
MQLQSFSLHRTFASAKSVEIAFTSDDRAGTAPWSLVGGIDAAVLVIGVGRLLLTIPNVAAAGVARPIGEQSGVQLTAWGEHRRVHAIGVWLRRNVRESDYVIRWAGMNSC